MASEKVIIEFEINAKEALNNITNAREALVTLREEQKALQKEIKAGTATDDMKKRFGELAVEIKELTGVISVNNRELQNQIKVQQSATGSLESYRAQLKNLKQAYAELSEEERNSEKGKEMISKMDSLTNSAKAAELQLQGVPAGLSKTVAAMGQVSPVAGKVTAAISKVGKAFKALMANPYALAIAAIVAVVKKLTDSFKKNDEAMTTLQKSMAPLKAILDVIEKAFQKIVDVVAKVIGKVGEFASKLVSIIPGMKDYVKTEEEIVTKTDELEDAEREYAKNHSDRQAEIAKQREIAADSENYTYEQRMNALKEAQRLEEEDIKERKNISARRYNIALEEAKKRLGVKKMTKEAWAKLTDEEKNKITELYTTWKDAETELSKFTRKNIKERNALTKQEESEKKAAAQAAAQAAKERVKNEKAALRELEDLTISAMKNLQAKEEEQTRVSYRRRIEDIQERIKTENNLTKKAKEALNDEIILLEGELQEKLGDIDNKYTEERLNRTKKLYKQFYDELLKTKPDDIELQVKISDFGFQTQIDSIKKRNEEIKKLLETASGEEKIALENELSMNNAIIGLIEKNAERAANKIRYEGETAKEAVLKANEELTAEIEDNKLLGIYYNNEVEKSRIFEEQSRRRLQTAQDEVTRLKSMTDEEIQAVYNTQEEYTNAVLNAENVAVQAENELAAAMRNTNTAIQEQQQNMLDAYSALASATNTLMSGFENLFNTLAEGDDKYAAYAKAMALTQVMVSTAVSIAYAVEGAVKAAKDTGPLAAIMLAVNIVAMVGAVVGAIAQATSILKKTTKPQKPKFSTGGPVEEGLVGGTTSERTDDTIEAKLSVGEFVVRSAAVKSIGVDNLNQMNATGMLPTQIIKNTTNTTTQFDWEQMKEVFVEAVSDIHPVVSVKEITSVQSAIQVKEELSKY